MQDCSNSDLTSPYRRQNGNVHIITYLVLARVEYGSFGVAAVSRGPSLHTLRPRKVATGLTSLFWKAKSTYLMIVERRDFLVPFSEPHQLLTSKEIAGRDSEARRHRNGVCQIAGWRGKNPRESKTIGARSVAGQN